MEAPAWWLTHLTQSGTLKSVTVCLWKGNLDDYVMKVVNVQIKSHPAFPFIPPTADIRGTGQFLSS